METLEHIKMATREEDNPEEQYEVSIRQPIIEAQKVVLADSFAKDASEFKDALPANLKRSIDRKIKKAEASRQVVTTSNAYSLFDVVEPPYNLATLARLYEASAPNYAAINAKVAHLVGLGFDYEVSREVIDAMQALESDKSREAKARKIDRLKNTITKKLNAISDERSFIDVMTKVVTDLEATGVGYIEVGRNVRGEIGYIGHVPSHTIRVRRAKDGFVQMVDGSVAYFSPFGKKPASAASSIMSGRPNELIQLKKFTPTNTYYGVPDIVAAKESAYGLISANAFNLDYFNNKAVPRYVVSIEGAKLDAKSEQVLVEFLRGLKGNSHRTVIVPLPANPQTKIVPKLKFDPVETEVQEASFTKYKTQSRDEVLMAHRTPINKVGGGTDANLASARDLDKTFKEQVVRPQQELIESKVNWIIEEWTDVLKLTFNEFTLTDEDTQSQIDQRDMMTGALLPNERRRKLNLSPYEGGDVPVPVSAQQRASANSDMRQNDARARERSAKAPDRQGEARNPKGEGRQAN